MKIYPDIYVNNVTKISLDILEKHNIKGLILDVDNTLIDYDRKVLDGAEEWCIKLKEKGIKFCIVSNSNKKDKVEKVATTFDIPYVYFAKKPFKKGFLEGAKIMGLEPENVAAVGDQIFTDVIGSNRCNMTSILVDPVAPKDIWITALKRPIEKAILNSYLKKQENNK